MPKSFSKEEDDYILENCISSGGALTYAEVGEDLNRSRYSVRSRWRKLQRKRLSKSSSSNEIITVSLPKKLFWLIFGRS